MPLLNIDIKITACVVFGVCPPHYGDIRHSEFIGNRPYYYNSTTWRLFLLLGPLGNSDVLMTWFLPHHVLQVPLICETKPMLSIQQMMTYQKNGCYQPPPHGGRQDHLSPDVARLMQLEEGVRPAEKRKQAHAPHHKREHKDKEHCSIDMNGLETNV